MTELEFIEQLKTAAFSHELYAKIGLTEDYIIRTIDGYNPKPKTQRRNMISNDPILRLVSDYDLSKTEIGMLTFSAEVTETDDYFYVGKDEVDFLCISKSTHEVVTLPFYGPLKVAYKCAQNSSLFLEAIVIAAILLEKRSMNYEFYDDAAAVAIAENCSDIAGGSDYLNFYRYLLGCL
jgi:hypothetical protein